MRTVSLFCALAVAALCGGCQSSSRQPVDSLSKTPSVAEAPAPELPPEAGELQTDKPVSARLTIPSVRVEAMKNDFESKVRAPEGADGFKSSPPKLPAQQGVTAH